LYFRATDGQYGEWSTQGCELDEEHSSSSKTVCLCNHLTNFALLLQRGGVVSVLLCFFLLLCMGLFIRKLNEMQNIGSQIIIVAKVLPTSVAVNHSS
jgi:hypothetical protein